MNHTTYPNLKQSILLVIFFFASFAIFFFFTGFMPQLFGWQLTESYISFIFSVASPICTIPLIIYVSKKSGIPVKWKVKLPGIHIIFLLALLAVSTRIIIQPFINPIEYFNNLIGGRFKLLDFCMPKFNFFTAINFICIVFIVPIFEEIFFRKQIFGLLLKKYSPTVSIVLSSVLFACAHGRINDIGALFIWGLLFCFVYYKTNSLEFSILLHSFTIGSIYFIKHEYIDSTEVQLFKYITMMAVSAIIIYLVIIYLVRHRLVKDDSGVDNSVAF